MPVRVQDVRAGDTGRTLSKVQTVGNGSAAVSYTVGYAYGSSGNVTGKQVSITYPSGNRINKLALSLALPDRSIDTGEPIALL